MNGREEVEKKKSNMILETSHSDKQKEQQSNNEPISQPKEVIKPSQEPVERPVTIGDPTFGHDL